jgi:hypothetical protein
MLKRAQEEETVRKMSPELTLALVGVSIGGGALVFAFLAWLNSRKCVKVAQRSLGISEEQLGLARQQVETRPVLEVTEVRLLEPEEAEGVDELLREVEEERAREREWAEKSEQVERLPLAKRLLEEDELSEEYTDLFAKERYQGPLPDKVVRVDLVNRGGAAAFGVAGWVYLESSHLEPLEYFSGGKVFNNRVGAYRVKVGDERDILLTPGGEYSFDIAVSVRSPGTTWVLYDLSSPMGSSTQNVKALEIPNQ